MSENVITLDRTFGVDDDDLTERFKEVISLENKLKNIKGLPIACYDKQQKRAYLEYPDGRREYIDD